jgi:hypothetical protein
MEGCDSKTIPGQKSTSEELNGANFGRMTGKPEANFPIADQPPGISVSLRVENKYFIVNGHLIGSSLR